MVDRNPESLAANQTQYQWNIVAERSDDPDEAKRGWVYPPNQKNFSTFAGAAAEYMLNDRSRTVKRTSPTELTNLDAHFRTPGLFALKQDLSENITNVQLPLSSLVEEAERPESERSALQCLDIPEGHMNALASWFDTIDVLERLQPHFKYKFVDTYFDSFRFWATANTSHCHSPHHIDSAGAGTACHIINDKGGKLWSLKGAPVGDPDARFRASTWTSDAVPDHEGDRFDFLYLRTGDEM